MIVYWLQQWCYSTTLSPLCLPPPPLTLFLPFMLFPLLSLLLSFLLPTSLPSFSLSYPHLFLSSLSPTPLPFPPLFLSPSFPHPSLLTFPDVSSGGMVTVEKVVVAVFGNVHSPSPVLQNLLNLIGHIKGSNRLYGCHMKGSSHRAVKKCWYVLKLWVYMYVQVVDCCKGSLQMLQKVVWSILYIEKKVRYKLALLTSNSAQDAHYAIWLKLLNMSDIPQEISLKTPDPVGTGGCPKDGKSRKSLVNQ